MLPETLGIKNAGGVISHPFGSAVRSLLIAIYELGVEEIFVVGHTDCGVQQSVQLLQEHPLIPQNVKIYGFVMDSVTGELKKLNI